jgi:hypothetical protein
MKDRPRHYSAAVFAGALFLCFPAGLRAASEAPARRALVAVKTTLPAAGGNRPELAVDGKLESFFQSSRGPDEKDHFTVELSPPASFQRIEVHTGSEGSSHRLAAGILEVSADGEEFEEVAAFELGSARAELTGREVKALRIRPLARERSRLAIREIVFEPPLAIEQAVQELCIFADTSEVPELEAWGRRAKELCEEWHPKIAGLLASDGFEPPLAARLLFRREMRGIANASGSDIRIAASWVTRNPGDFGMVIHELTHVIQSYRGQSGAGWLVEGIADYIRLFHFEPEARRPRIDPDRASYRDSYKTTAIFLAWVKEHHDAQIVRKLNAALRKGEFKEAMFAEHTGKTVDELWRAFTDSLRRRVRL